MKIALIGYGKMGHAVEQQALARGHEIVCRIDAGEEDKFLSPEFKGADVAIEFSVPSAAVDNYRRAFAAGVPVVSGTTAWTDRLPEVLEMLRDSGATLMWSSNYSVGVNIFRRLNVFLTRMMARFPVYRPALHEVHHIHKLDHPSGTAKTLADELVAASPDMTGWSETECNEHVLHVTHEREGEVPGTHIVTWTSPVDRITIEHRAFSRDGFALGAVMAAEWLAESGRSGYLTIDDMMTSMGL